MRIEAVLLILTSVSVRLTSSDQCTTYTLISDQIRRSAANIYSPSDIAISDNFLVEGWYRFESGAGNDMVTSAPPLARCGTVYPVWLQGTIPTQADGVVDRTACVVGIMGNCESSIAIRIADCGGYRVYYLSPTASTGTAYCIGENLPCPSGQGSETGFSPGCGNVPNDTIVPFVKASLETGPILNAIFGNSLYAVFKCEFLEYIDPLYFYDIYWYINTGFVKSTKNVSAANLNTTWLLPQDWVNSYNLNMVVKCSVRLRLSSGSPPGDHQNSAEFAAGVFPESNSYTVQEGSTISIPFRVTVPVGCIGDGAWQDKCVATVHILTPEYQSDIEQCQNYTRRDTISFGENGCGILIKSSEWNESKILNVTGNVDNLINAADREVYIRLGTQTINGMDVSKVWDNITIPDIKIYIADSESSMEERICQMNTDPRFWSFDRQYRDIYDAGEFILFRHKKRNIQVNALFSGCPFGGSCPCGIAVRVEDSFYAFRSCQQISYHYTNTLVHESTIYEICNDQHIIVEIGSPWTTIRLPTGTVVKYSRASSWLFWIHIIPSLLDVENVEGLCGNANGNAADDPTDPTAWRISPSSLVESLFVKDPLLTTTEHYLQKYCSCASEATGGTWQQQFVDMYSVDCNITTAMVECSRHSTGASFTSTCDQTNRKKRSPDTSDTDVIRSTIDTDDVVDFPALTYDPNFNTSYVPPELSWRNGWTETTAREFCMSQINGDAAKVQCEKYIDISNTTNGKIEECVKDIKDSGTTYWVAGTIDAIKSVCYTRIKMHERFYIKNGTGPSVVEIFSLFVCPNNCSGNGVCSNGKCDCNSGFIGSDCSGSVGVPPGNTTIPESGMCKKSIRKCLKTNIMGSFDSNDIHVKFEYFTITQSGKSTIQQTSTALATYRIDTLITVTFPVISRKKRSTTSGVYATGFDISLSYDGVNFGLPMTIVMYDDQCYECNSTTVTCTQLTSCGNQTTSSIDSTTNALTSSAVETGFSNQQLTESSTTNVLSSNVTQSSISTSRSDTTYTSAKAISVSTLKYPPKKSPEDGGIHTGVIVAICVVIVITGGVAVVFFVKKKFFSATISIDRIKSVPCDQPIEISAPPVSNKIAYTRGLSASDIKTTLADQEN